MITETLKKQIFATISQMEESGEAEKEIDDNSDFLVSRKEKKEKLLLLVHKEKKDESFFFVYQKI